MYTVYILQSLKNNRYYTGQTSDIENRLETHNNAKVKSTKNFIPWKLIYTENYSNRSDACKRELEIKSYKGGILFKKLLGLWKN
jgi:putative endonuclease